MKLDNFKNNLDIYGSNLHKWPDELRKQAEDLLINSVEAQDLFSEETNLDMLINPDSTHPPHDFVDKIVTKTKKD